MGNYDLRYTLRFYAFSCIVCVVLPLRYHRSRIGLFGNHIDVVEGKWTATDAGIGAGVDSYYEYLVKGSILLKRPELVQMFR